jgi:hypothetical protein
MPFSSTAEQFLSSHDDIRAKEKAHRLKKELERLGCKAEQFPNKEDMEYANTYIPSIMHGGTLNVCFVTAKPDDDELMKVVRQ